MAKAAPNAPEDKVALYEKVVTATAGAERKGATMPYTSTNGHMWSYLGKTGVVALRLPTEAREAFLEKYDTKLSEQHGIIQKEYVDVPPALLEKTKELAKHFAASLKYVSALKPKATTRKK